MKVVDANVLVYAVNSDAPQHDDSLAWLESALGGGERVGFSWVALLAFVRLTTRQGLLTRPLDVPQATDQVARWLAAPAAVQLDPGPAHAGHLAALLGPGLVGNIVNDAHLAALALENRASVVTWDRDFARFEVPWSRPSELLPRT